MREIGAPLRRAFAHNDNDQPDPLWGALAHGFTAVEADVVLVDGELRLGHAARHVVPGRTLSSVYLEPLAELVADRGQVFPDRSLMLLVDVKSEATTTYAALHEVLLEHRAMLTQHRHDGTLTGPVRVVVSGHTDLPQMEAQLVRYASADARIPHLEEVQSPAVTMVSAKWGKHFSWQGEGTIRARERAELKRIVARIHETGCTARFWGTDPRVWPELLAAGVDHIIADDLSGLQDFLAANDP